jgi:hypothetical protein
MECYLDADADYKLFMPNWLEFVDVTDDKSYSMYALSLINE